MRYQHLYVIVNHGVILSTKADGIYAKIHHISQLWYASHLDTINVESVEKKGYKKYSERNEKCGAPGCVFYVCWWKKFPCEKAKLKRKHFAILKTCTHLTDGNAYVQDRICRHGNNGLIQCLLTPVSILRVIHAHCNWQRRLIENIVANICCQH